MIAERAVAGRWTLVRDALVSGAKLDRAAEAIGVEVAELTAGLRGWADGQLRQDLMTQAEHDEVITLVGGDR